MFVFSGIAMILVREGGEAIVMIVFGLSEGGHGRMIPP